MTSRDSRDPAAGEPAVPDLGTLDFAAVTPVQFARIIKRTPGRTMAALMNGPHRRPVLDELFRRMRTLFRPAAAPERATLIRWRITGPGTTADVYETYLAEGNCTITGHPTDRAPRLTLTMAAPELLRLASGNASGPVLFLTRKIRAHGDLRLAATLLHCFDIPKP